MDAGGSEERLISKGTAGTTVANYQRGQQGRWEHLAAGRSWGGLCINHRVDGVMVLSLFAIKAAPHWALHVGCRFAGWEIFYSL